MKKKRSMYMRNSVPKIDQTQLNKSELHILYEVNTKNYYCYGITESKDDHYFVACSCKFNMCNKAGSSVYDLFEKTLFNLTSHRIGYYYPSLASNITANVEGNTSFQCYEQNGRNGTLEEQKTVSCPHGCKLVLVADVENEYNIYTQDCVPEMNITQQYRNGLDIISEVNTQNYQCYANRGGKDNHVYFVACSCKSHLCNEAGSSVYDLFEKTVYNMTSNSIGYYYPALVRNTGKEESKKVKDCGDWVKSSDENSKGYCFKTFVTNEELSYSEAEEFCVNENAYVAEMNSEEKKVATEEATKKVWPNSGLAEKKYQIFLGAKLTSQTFGETDKFYWIHSHTKVEKYTNWAKDQPDYRSPYGGKLEHCMMFQWYPSRDRNTVEWHDVHCDCKANGDCFDKTGGIVCEKKLG